MELNERERNIVNLINNLSEVADDEATTQEAIDRIMSQIKKESTDNINANLRSAEEESNPVESSRQKMLDEMHAAIINEQKKMMGDISNEIAQRSQSQERKSANRLLFTRVREVKVPCKAHPTDAGIDFFVPDAKAWTDDYKSMVRSYSKNPNHQDLVFIGVNGVEVAPGAHVAIPAGIKTIIPQGLAMMMVNKSGVATKLKLDHSACLIDSEYRDELIFCFFNNNQERIVIEPGMKITQGLIVPVINLEIQEVLNRVYEDMGRETDRGGGFGSSGTH